MLKTLPAQYLAFMKSRNSKRNLSLLIQFCLVLLFIVLFYSAIFHFIMMWEGREYSWLTSFYWTLTVMSTLGFGDITFHTDIGRLFSIVVLLTGVVFMLIVFPFTFIQFFYAPFIDAHAQRRAPKQLPQTTRNHVILTHLDPITNALIRRLRAYGYQYTLIEPDINQALALHDTGYDIMVGDIDDPDTYRRVRFEQAALMAVTGTDPVNTNVTFTAREYSDKVPIVTTASHKDSVDILELAGSNEVLQIPILLGQFFARRANSDNTEAHVIGQFEDILIAEATVRNTTLEGKRLRETKIKADSRVVILGTWERGFFKTATADTLLTRNTVIVMAGTKEQIDKYNQVYGKKLKMQAPVIVIGAGRVGRATARELKKRGYPYCIIDRDAERVSDHETGITGDAADLETLRRANFDNAPTIIITTNDDDINIYLTIYCRRLRSDVLILSRSTRERNIPTFHRAGADFVMSYASLGANIIFNFLENTDILMLAEGVDIFRIPLPASLDGKSIIDSKVQQNTGCIIVAIYRDGKSEINPAPDTILSKTQELLLIGTAESEDRFLKHYALSKATK